MSAAVLLTCHGTVDRAEDVRDFLANIRRGRPAPRGLVEEVTRRLERIGGSPLMRITHEQAAALEARLGVPVRVAARLWRPYPAAALADLAACGVRTVVSLPLAPQSVHVYHDAVREAAAQFRELELRYVPAWGTEPAMVDALVELIDEGLAGLDPVERTRTAIVLTAHSLPLRVIEAGDLYEQQFRAMAEAVRARIAPRGNPTRIAFQSQGASGERWLGPDLPTTFADLAASGTRSVLVAPVGFMADHLETLYDLDVEAPELAVRAGIERLSRAPAPNARPRFIDALEAVARRALGP